MTSKLSREDKTLARLCHRLNLLVKTRDSILPGNLPRRVQVCCGLPCFIHDLDIDARLTRHTDETVFNSLALKMPLEHIRIFFA